MNDPRYPQYPPQPYPQPAQAYPVQPAQPYPMQPAQPYPAPPAYPPQPTPYPPPAMPPPPMGMPPQPPGAMPMQGMPPQAAGPLPSYYIPDEQTVQAGYQVARDSLARMSDGGQRAQFVKFLGPTGETKWASVHPGYVANLPVYILPARPAQPGQPPSNIYIESASHFWKSMSRPQGMTIQCPGPDKCLICAARQAGLAHPDPQVQKRAKDFARVRTQYLYQVVLLQYPAAHLGKDGVMRPQILGAGKKLHTAIGDLIKNRGIARIVDPMHGRPIMLKKAKTGREERDVDYGALDLEPAPLPQMFYPALQNMFDLHEFVKPPSQEDMMRAVQDMGLPMPGMPQQSAMFQPAPVAPWANPYQQPQQPMQFQGFQPQMGMQSPPPVASGFQMPLGPPPVPTPAYQPPGDPMEFPPQQSAMPPPPPPPMGPMGGFVPSQVTAGQAYVQQPPVNLAPPPVVSQPQAQPAYTMQPANPMQPQVAQPMPQGIPPPPAVPMAAPVLSNAADTPHQITVPVPPGSLSGGRDKCFGKHNPVDVWCQQCPDWIKGQCLPMTPAAVPVSGPAPMVDAKLQQLQQQLSGGQPS